MAIGNKEMKKILAEQQEQTERYLGALKEDFDSKLDAVLEYVKDIPAIKNRQEIMFDKMGEMAEDVTIVKEVTKDQERRLQKLEARR